MGDGEQSRALGRLRAEFGIVDEMLLLDHAAQQGRRFHNCDLIVERQGVHRALGRAVAAGQLFVSGVEYDLSPSAEERRLQRQPDLPDHQSEGCHDQDKFPPPPQEI